MYKNKVLNIVDIERGKQLSLHLLSYSVTLCLTYVGDDNNFSTDMKVIVFTAYVICGVTLCGSKCIFNSINDNI